MAQTTTHTVSFERIGGGVSFRVTSVRTGTFNTTAELADDHGPHLEPVIKKVLADALLNHLSEGEVKVNINDE